MVNPRPHNARKVVVTLNETIMSRMNGPKECFVPIREDASQVIVSYEKVADGKKNAFWHEVYFFKKRTAKPTIEQIKAAVYADINAQTDEKILSGFVWNDINVWLSEENQRNFSEAQRIAMIMPDAILPVKFKLGEDAEGNPVYHTFETSEELTGFYLQAVAFINQTLAEGWDRKDGIDWELYEQALNTDAE